jgi:hypothetical protein
MRKKLKINMRKLRDIEVDFQRDRHRVVTSMSRLRISEGERPGYGQCEFPNLPELTNLVYGKTKSVQKKVSFLNFFLNYLFNQDCPSGDDEDR